MKFGHLKKGDEFTRILGEVVRMPMIVTDVQENEIFARAKDGPCGYKFCRETGAEIDEELRWGPKFTGSRIE